jgi:hypothetical protein
MLQFWYLLVLVVSANPSKVSNRANLLMSKQMVSFTSRSLYALKFLPQKKMFRLASPLFNAKAPIAGTIFFSFY